MKDSQRVPELDGVAGKYIKVNNERFSTRGHDGTQSVLIISR